MRLFIMMTAGIHTQVVKPLKMVNKSLIGSTVRIAYNNSICKQTISQQCHQSTSAVYSGELDECTNRRVKSNSVKVKSNGVKADSVKANVK